MIWCHSSSAFSVTSENSMAMLTIGCVARISRSPVACWPSCESTSGKKQMLRDSVFDCTHHMPLLTDTYTRATERRMKLHPVLMMESTTEVSVVRAIETEWEGGSVCESFFGLANDVNNTTRLLLNLIAEHICGDRCFEHVLSHWQTVEQFLPSTKARDWL